MHMYIHAYIHCMQAYAFTYMSVCMHACMHNTHKYASIFYAPPIFLNLFAGNEQTVLESKLPTSSTLPLSTLPPTLISSSPTSLSNMSSSNGNVVYPVTLRDICFDRLTMCLQ